MPVISTIGSDANEALGGKCIEATTMYLAQSYADISLDFLILLTPLPISEWHVLLNIRSLLRSKLVAKLHMKLLRKIQISGIFFVGIM